MRFRSIAVAPVVLSALTLTAAMLAPPSVRDAVVQGEVDASKVLALVGLGAAALAFGRGDYLRRGWGALAVSYVFFLARDAMLFATGAASHAVFEAVRAVLVTAGNVCLVVGTWTLARAWAAAGLEHPGGRFTRRAFVIGGLFVSLALAGPIFVADVRDLAFGVRTDFEMIPSDLGDVLCLPLVAPVCLTALAVREGTLRWTWMLLAGSLLGGLLYDAVYIVPDYVHAASRAAFHFYSEQFHVAAGTLACAAGLAQRRAVIDDEES